MKKITDQPVMKVLFITFIFLVIIMAFYVKILGSTNLGYLVEKNGYCKTAFEDNKWKYSESKEYCFNTNRTRELEPITFTKEDFRIICSKNKFFSTQFYSDCFYAGDFSN